MCWPTTNPTKTAHEEYAQDFFFLLKCTNSIKKVKPGVLTGVSDEEPRSSMNITSYK